MNNAIRQVLLLLIAIYGPLLVLAFVVLRYWMQHPELTEMQVFLKWWHVILLTAAANIYSAWLWAKGENNDN